MKIWWLERGEQDGGMRIYEWRPATCACQPNSVRRLACGLPFPRGLIVMNNQEIGSPGGCAEINLRFDKPGTCSRPFPIAYCLYRVSIGLDRVLGLVNVPVDVDIE